MSKATDHADYLAFLSTKLPSAPSVGIEVAADDLHPRLFPHQRAITKWAIRKGRAAVWCDTGLGKSGIYLEWARVLPGRTLILAPLGVAQQLVNDEGPKWGATITYARSEAEAPAEGITVTNYERLAAFDPKAWPKVVLDEADVLANYSGTTKRALISSFRDTPYKLTATATPAPNDTVELCNQADFLNVMTQREMLSRFFTPKGAANSASGQYKLKGHASRDFYSWLATWAIACKSPADLGYDATAFSLPPLNIHAAFIPVDWTPPGYLFLVDLKGVTQRAQVRRETLEARVCAAVDLVNREPNEQWLLWYGLLDEGKMMADLVPGLVMLQGGDTMERKSEVLMAFAHGEIKHLATHAKIAGAGLNMQSCARTAFVGMSDSWRQYYQCIRRMWRYGQTRPVDAYIVLSEPERAIYNNVLRKEGEAHTLTTELVAAMRDFNRAELEGVRNMSDPYEPTQEIIIPAWLKSVKASKEPDFEMTPEYLASGLARVADEMERARQEREAYAPTQEIVLPTWLTESDVLAPEPEEAESLAELA